MGKNFVRYRGIVRRDTISRYQSQRFGTWIQYLDISYLVILHDMAYDITIYRDISCDITPDHLETSGKYNSTKTHHLFAVYSCFFWLCLCPPLGLSSVWHFLSPFCCPSAGHIIGLTAPPANSNLVPSRLGLLPGSVFVLLHFSLLFFSSFISFRLFPS